tara:strand:+ start:22350 stop:22679 length:330 start_codon:yes stop_codon:yes gene_type:complete
MKSFPSVSLLFVLGLLLTILPPSVHAEPEGVTYLGLLSGVECTGCKRTISRSLAKMEGVKTIRIVKKGKSNHRLEVVTDGSHEITKSDAETALKNADHYKILTWAKSNS